MPELMYDREGRRIQALYQLRATDLCPSAQADAQRSDHTCQAAPRGFRDAIAVGDYQIDVHLTGAGKPYLVHLPWPYQVPFRSLIPAGTTGVLVGSALGADRLAYGALRVDPLRMMIGTAMGEAVAEAKAARLARFQQLNVERLRETLALDRQETFPVAVAPRLDTDGWKDQDVGATIQRLLARGVIQSKWAPSPADVSIVVNPDLALDNTTGAQLSQTLANRACIHGTPPWETQSADVTRAQLLGRGAGGGLATVGDAYTWLLAHSCQPRLTAAGAS
jgi:hypothetical protein